MLRIQREIADSFHRHADREVLLSRANELALAHPGYVSATNDSGMSKLPVMAVLVTAIHVLQRHQDVDARDKPGHDGGASTARTEDPGYRFAHAKV